MDERGVDLLEKQEHPLEKLLLQPRVQRIAGWLARGNHRHRTTFERLMFSYGNPDCPERERLLYAPFHWLIDHTIRKYGLDAERLKFKLFHHTPTLRALVNTLRSLEQYGLTMPQRFAMPLIVVWNFTQACNLHCRHCYQEACRQPRPDELSLAEKLRIVDEMGREYVPFLALSGGEPLLGRHFWEVVDRCRQRDIHVTVASNGTTITGETAARLAEAGVKYVEISIDSVVPHRHDEFRGIPGAWQRAMDGIQALAATPGIRVGMAACLSRFNVHELEEMIRLAVELGCSTFVHFNYIPVGRGIKNDIGDLLPEQREEVLRILNGWLQSGRIGIMSTAPQFARACYMYADPDGLMAVGHAGSGGGRKTRVLAKYIGGCGAARCYCAIQPNGDVTPCVYIPHRVVGNLKTSSLKEIWQNNPYFHTLHRRETFLDNCGRCRYRSICGGCRARADACTGDIRAGDPGCIYNRSMTTGQPEPLPVHQPAGRF